MYWKRADDLVDSWIINSIHTDIRSSCLFAESALQLFSVKPYKNISTNICHCYLETRGSFCDCLVHKNQSPLGRTLIYRAFCSLHPWCE